VSELVLAMIEPWDTSSGVCWEDWADLKEDFRVGEGDDWEN